MPRAGLNTFEVVAAGAELADESGIGSVSFAALSSRLGVKAPALYKHVDSVGDLQRRIATLAMVELGDQLREALQGKAGADAMRALFMAVQTFIAAHPGRYAATIGAQFGGSDDPLFVAASRVIGSVRAVVSGYGVHPDQLDHAVRTLRCMIQGYAQLQAVNAFQWGNDPEASLDWMIRFVDAGLRAVGEDAR